jgi:hypothetical protein
MLQLAVFRVIQEALTKLILQTANKLPLASDSLRPKRRRSPAVSATTFQVVHFVERP